MFLKKVKRSKARTRRVGRLNSEQSEMMKHGESASKVAPQNKKRIQKIKPSNSNWRQWSKYISYYAIKEEEGQPDSTIV